MPAFRLVFLVAIAIGLLAAVALSSTERATRDQRTATAGPLPAPTYRPTQTVEVKLPHDGPIQAHVGDMIAIRYTPTESDVLELDDFGFEQGVAGGVPTTVRIVAVRPGRFPLHLRAADRTLVELEVAPRAPISGGVGPADDD